MFFSALIGCFDCFDSFPDNQAALVKALVVNIPAAETGSRSHFVFQRLKPFQKFILFHFSNLLLIFPGILKADDVFQ